MHSHASKCSHTLVFAPESLRCAQLQPLHKTAQNRGPKHHGAIGSVLWGSGFHQNFPRMGVHCYHPNRADPNDSAAVISEEALMQMLIILQGKV